jgi:hypothetical protein
VSFIYSLRLVLGVMLAASTIAFFDGVGCVVEGGGVPPIADVGAGGAGGTSPVFAAVVSSTAGLVLLRAPATSALGVVSSSWLLSARCVVAVVDAVVAAVATVRDSEAGTVARRRVTAVAVVVVVVAVVVAALLGLAAGGVLTIGENAIVDVGVESGERLPRPAVSSGIVAAEDGELTAMAELGDTFAITKKNVSRLKPRIHAFVRCTC